VDTDMNCLVTTHRNIIIWFVLGVEEQKNSKMT